MLEGLDLEMFEEEEADGVTPRGKPSIGTSSISLRGSPDTRRSGQGSGRCPTLRRLIEGGSMTAVPVTAEIAKRAAHLAWNDLPDDLSSAPSSACSTGSP